MYEYQLIENELDTKYIGRVFLQFDKIDSTAAKCRNISQTCPSGMLVLTEDDLDGNNYLKKDLKDFKNKVLMSLILKLDRNNFNKDNIETLITCLGAGSLLSTVEEYFDDLDYYWEKIIKGREIAAEIDSQKSLKSNDRSIMMNFKIFYNKNIGREILIGKLLNKIEEYIETSLKNDSFESVIDKCSSKLKCRDSYIRTNKKSRKTVKELENIKLNSQGNLVGKHKSQEMCINWKDYEIEWCD